MKNSIVLASKHCASSVQVFLSFLMGQAAFLHNLFFKAMTTIQLVPCKTVQSELTVATATKRDSFKSLGSSEEPSDNAS